MFIAWAGADRNRERRGSSPLRLSLPLVLLIVTTVSASCGSAGKPPSTLLDGAPATAPTVELEGVESAVLTKLLVRRLADVVPGSPEADCLAGPAKGAKAVGVVVRRVGVASQSVTVRERRGVVSCDGSRSPREAGRRWCGGSYGRLYGGRLRDPRLDIAGCRTRDGDEMAFAWVEPGVNTRYVVIAQPGFAEVYPVVPGLPVRVATTARIQSDPVGATFEISEHDGTGRRLRSHELVARPAG